MYAYGEFLGGNKEWRDELSKYINVLCPYNSKLTNNNKKITFYESHDTHLNFDHNDLYNTRELDEHDLTYIYKRLRSKYKNTIVYVSPCDIKGPYVKNEEMLSCEDVKKLDEKDYFNRLYLESSEINKINNNKKLVLKLK
jgi:ABC-type Fe3+-citrate transport system substrate-binding protein